MRQYQFVTGISLALLQDEVNRLAADHPDLTLNQVLHVPAHGFVAVLARDVDILRRAAAEETRTKPEATRTKKPPPRAARRRV
jgi:hypothetical protein